MNFTSFFKQKNNPFEKKIEYLANYVKSQAFADYLNFIIAQHKSIFNLYRVMLIVFVLFIFLVSYFLFLAFKTMSIPPIGFYLLGAISFSIILIAVKGFLDLLKFKKRSKSLLDQNYQNIQYVLGNNTTKPPTKFPPKSLSAKANAPKKAYGWDTKSCPYCNHKVELLKDTCPRCKEKIEIPLPS